MKYLKSITFLALFSGILFADILPAGSKTVGSTLLVKGLDSDSRTSNGSTLVLFIQQVNGKEVVTKVQDSMPVSKGYKFNTGTLYFVSPNLLAAAGDVSNIDYKKAQAGLTKANIEVDAGFIIVPKDSPLVSRTITYQVK